MIIVNITPEQKQYAWELVNKINFGKRGNFDGNKIQQYTGLLGEVVFSDELALPRPTGEGGFDNGIDFEILGNKVDLKTMGRTTDVKPYYVNNLIKSQTSYSTEIYIFASINKEKSTFTVCGSLRKSDLPKYFFPKGSIRTRSDDTKFVVGADMYEIPNSVLTPINAWTTIMNC